MEIENETMKDNAYCWTLKVIDSWMSVSNFLDFFMLYILFIPTVFAVFLRLIIPSFLNLLSPMGIPPPTTFLPTK